MNKMKQLCLITFDLSQRGIKHELEHVHCKGSEARYMLAEVLVMHFKGAILMMFIKVTMVWVVFGPPDAQAKLYHF